MKLLNIFLISLFLFSCTTKLPQDYFYNLDVSYKEKLFYGQPLTGNVEIKDITANGLLSGQAIVFVDKKGEYSTYKHAYWEKTPEVVLEEKLKEFLLKSATVEDVVSGNGDNISDYDIFAQIENLEQKEVETGQIYGYVKIKFSVFDKNKKKMILLDRYESKKELPSENIDIFVSSVSSEIKEILNNLIEDLRGRLS